MKIRRPVRQLPPAARAVSSSPTRCHHGALIGLLLAAIPVGALGLGITLDTDMPLGARSWLEATSNGAVRELGAVGAMSPTALEFDDLHQSIGASLVVSGFTDAGYMEGHSVASGNTGGFTFFTVSMVDSFRLHSDTLPSDTTVNITAFLSMEGVATRNQGQVGAAGANAYVGHWNPAPDADEINSRVTPHTSGGNAFFPFSTSALNASFEAQASRAFTQSLGTDFDIGFQLLLTTFSSAIDVGGTVSFALPDGVYITSASGFSQGAPTVGSGGGGPATSVPDQGATLAPLLLSLGIATLMRPRMPTSCRDAKVT